MTSATPQLPLLGELCAQGSGKLGDVIRPERLPHHDIGDGAGLRQPLFVPRTVARLRCAIALTLVISNSVVPSVARFRPFYGSAAFNGQLAARTMALMGLLLIVALRNAFAVRVGSLYLCIGVSWLASFCQRPSRRIQASRARNSPCSG